LIDRSSGVRRVCCWAPCGQDISIDSDGRLVPSSNSMQNGAAAANDDSVAFTAAVEG